MTARRAASSCRGQGGFTLLETIVVLVIVGFIGAGLAEGTRFGIAATRTANRWVAHDDDAATAERVLRTLVVNAVAVGAGGDDAAPFSGGAHGLRFATVLPTPPPGLQVAAAEASVAVEHGALVLRLSPRYPGATLAPARAVRLVLAEGVGGLDVSYWGRGDLGTAWRATWNAAELPLLVRFHVVPRAGSRMPPWPDIVAGPFRMQIPS